MDLRAPSRLRGRMVENDDKNGHDELVRQLFYLLTACFEDGAAAAAEGQSAAVGRDARVELAHRLQSLAQEAMILADAAVALSSRTDPQAEGRLDAK